ncbi:ADP-ribosylglycohydrolase family protein [[Mycobacterium] kokjensenii]|uniref:ADP-ribosylglycohydrolase family protein n=1 Tax=[Mycobacterium] kokjensenii TaxID=3064287 RepID=A0ABN9MRT0_9MYCO|nr:ADP-ribosylglycohydrolase family protein [Mycolicibacter sp. MU0083]CAJ1493926.1 ADP-ribosylglycohydrolase family protein [Mycolicibacter sp. MU0083]
MGNTRSTPLTTIRRDRARGGLLGAAAGEALAAANGGAWAGGTARVIPVAELLAAGADVREKGTRERIAARWDWWRGSAGGGDRTTSVIPAAPAALACLGDAAELAGVVRPIAALIQHDPDVSDSAVLWCAAIRHAILTRELDIRAGLQLLESSRQRLWSNRFDEAERHDPSACAANGESRGALPRALSTIVHTPIPDDDPANGVFRVDHLRNAVQAAVRDGASTEEAAIIGGLLGAVYGASAVPGDWRLTLRGWPGIRAHSLDALADTIIGWAGAERRNDTSVNKVQLEGSRHPHDDDLWIGGVSPYARVTSLLRPGLDVVVTLSEAGDPDPCYGVITLDVRPADFGGDTVNVDFGLLDTVRVLERLRADGRAVFVHALLGTGHAVAVGALYGARRRGIGIEDALRDVVEALRRPVDLDDEVRAALYRLAGAA